MISEPMIKDYLEEFITESNEIFKSQFPSENLEDTQESFRAHFFQTQSSEYVAYSDSHAKDELRNILIYFICELKNCPFPEAKLSIETGLQPISFKRWLS